MCTTSMASDGEWITRTMSKTKYFHIKPIEGVTYPERQKGKGATRAEEGKGSIGCEEEETE